MELYLIVCIASLLIGGLFVYFVTYPNYERGFQDGQVRRVKKEIKEQIYMDGFGKAIEEMYNFLEELENSDIVQEDEK